MNAIELFQQGLSKREIADQLGIGYSTVRLHLKGVAPPSITRQHKCRRCGKIGLTNFYASKTYVCKTCWNAQTYTSSKDKILTYMNTRGGAKCQRCSYDKYVGALEFHHRDPTQKDPKWSRGWGISRLKIELDKCDILCANCHREVHHEMRTSNP